MSFKGAFKFCFYLGLVGIGAPGQSREFCFSDQASVATINEKVFQPGDRILFKGGITFYGGLRLDRQSLGDPNNPIVISSCGEGRAILEAGPHEDGILLEDIEGVVVENLIIRGAQPGKSQGNGIHVRSRSAELSTGHITLRNLEISDFVGLDQEHHYFGVGILVDNTLEGGGVADVKISDLKVHHNEQTGIQSVSHNRYRHKRISIERIEAYEHLGNPASHMNTGSGIKLGQVSHALVAHSTVYKNGDRNNANGGPVGIWAWEADNVIFRKNSAFQNRTASEADGGGFDFDGDVTDSLMEDNLSWDNDGPGFMLCGEPSLGPVKRVIVRNNRSVHDARKNTYAGLFVYGEVHDALFEKNDVHMVRSDQGESSVIGLLNWTGQNLRFVANTFRIGEPISLIRLINSSHPEGLLPEKDGAFPGLIPLIAN